MLEENTCDYYVHSCLGDGDGGGGLVALLLLLLLLGATAWCARRYQCTRRGPAVPPPAQAAPQIVMMPGADGRMVPMMVQTVEGAIPAVAEGMPVHATSTPSQTPARLKRRCFGAVVMMAMAVRTTTN